MTLILVIGVVWVLGNVLFLSLVKAAAMGDRLQAEQLDAERLALSAELPEPSVEASPPVAARAA